MCKLPLIMPECLLGKMVNSEYEKKTLFNKEISYDRKVLEKLVAMVSDSSLDITKLEELNSKELKDVAQEIGISKLSKL